MQRHTTWSLDGEITRDKRKEFNNERNNQKDKRTWNLSKVGRMKMQECQEVLQEGGNKAQALLKEFNTKNEPCTRYAKQQDFA